jgi:xylulokinase
MTPMRRIREPRTLPYVPTDLTLTLRLDPAALTATITDRASATIAEASAPYETIVHEPGWAEQRPDDWQHALRTAIDPLPTDALAAVTRITLAGDLRAILFLDAEHQPIRNAILAADGRAQDGVPSIIEWLRANQTIAFKRIQHLTTPRGYLRLLLTNTLALDHADAATTQLLDDAGEHWSAERCDSAEVNGDILPPLLTRRHAEPLATEVAAKLGINPRAVLIPDS